MTLTLPAIHRLAQTWCPVQARWDGLLIGWDDWGPAHELAHALLARSEERALSGYGLCASGSCCHAGERCHVVELAAHRISGHLLTVAMRSDLAEQDVWATDCYLDIATESNLRASWLMLRAERLWPLPRTVGGLERLLRRRLAP